MILKYIEDKAEEILTNNNFLFAGFDIEKLVESMGVKLIDKEFDDDISGLFFIKEGIPVITYNSKESKKRIRFTIAHELGHYVLHSIDQKIFLDRKPQKVLYRNSVSSSGESLKEREANSFAAALLMPKSLIDEKILRAEIDELGDLDVFIENMASVFKVSTQAMTFRLSNLGYDILF
ncbi:MAG: ImmA/IrrE family metallo-endopeptidase [Bacteroidota bacterium]